MKRRLFSAVLGALFLLSQPAWANDPYWSLFEAIDEAPVIVSPATEGQVFVSISVAHRIVGFLENDIRGTRLVNSDRVVIPRGTPVFFAAFATQGTSFAPHHHYEGWCGVVMENGAERGYCMLRQGRGYALAILPRDDSFFAPTRLANYALRPITTPEVRSDSAARAAFPSMTYSYALDGWRPGGVMLERSANIGGIELELGPLFVGRNEAGSVVLRVDDEMLVLTSTGAGEGVTAQRETVTVISSRPLGIQVE